MTRSNVFISDGQLQKESCSVTLHRSFLAPTYVFMVMANLHMTAKSWRLPGNIKYPWCVACL